MSFIEINKNDSQTTNDRKVNPRNKWIKNKLLSDDYKELLKILTSDKLEKSDFKNFVEKYKTK